MATLTKLPTTNLKWDDIRDTLNANGGTVTNNVASAFASAANINKWSKYKPVDFNAEFSDVAYKGNDGACGLTIPLYSNYTDACAAVISGNNLNWNYTKLPSGGASSPYRLGDFRGYNPTASIPVLTLSNIVTNMSNNTYRLTINPSAIVNNLLLTDIKYGGSDLKDWYYYLVLMNNTSKVPLFQLNATGNISSCNYIDIPLDYDTAPHIGFNQYYDCCVLITDGSQYIPLPIPDFTLWIGKTVASAYIEASYRYDTDGNKVAINWDMYTDNTSDSDVTDNVTMELQYYDTDYQDGARWISVGYEEEKQGLTAPANTIKYDTHEGGSIDISLLSEFYQAFDYRFKVYSQGGTLATTYATIQ